MTSTDTARGHEPGDVDDGRDAEADKPAAEPAQPIAEPVEASPTELEPESESAAIEPEPDPEPSPEPDPEPEPESPLALSWTSEIAVTASAEAGIMLDTSVIELASADLLANVPRRSLVRPGVIIPSALIASLVAAYAATTLLWPLHAIPPEIRAVPVDAIPAAAAAPAWPVDGSAGISVVGIPGTLSDSTAQLPIASITKVITCLLVLEELPLSPGEQGPSYSFTEADADEYARYLGNDESALQLPLGGSLTQYQLMQGILIGSANNYADRLAGSLWPDNAVFARAAADWLTLNGIEGMTIVNPSGMDPRNTATHDALIKVAAKALTNPVVAEIVRTQGVDLPGAGWVENTNDLLSDPGMLGIKTGYYESLNLLSAKEVTIGDTPVRMLGSVLGQPNTAARAAATRALYAQTEAELQLTPSVVAGTSVGVVETRWADPVTIETATDASVVLWNGGAGEIVTLFDLGDQRTAGETVGALTVTGPLDATTVDVRLAHDVPDPSPWWRLTHPLDLFGLSG